MKKLVLPSSGRNLHYTLRFASAMCFIGHGAFGIITKKIWLNYFAVFGIGPVLGYQLMPWLGAADILLGVSLLIYPTRLVLGWLVMWGLLTALLRPLSGEPFAETIERAGNYGAPFVLLLIAGLSNKTFKDWFARLGPVDIDHNTIALVNGSLRVIIFLLLAGHGWLNLLEKKGLIDQYTSLGFSDPTQVARIAGIFEIAAALAVLLRPARQLLIVLLVWKMGTELFYPHWEAFEWIERGGSYGSTLALWLILPRATAPARESV